MLHEVEARITRLLEHARVVKRIIVRYLGDLGRAAKQALKQQPVADDVLVPSSSIRRASAALEREVDAAIASSHRGPTTVPSTINCRSTVDQLSINCRSTVDQPSFYFLWLP